MSQQPDFLNQFEEKMNKLTQVRSNIQQAIQFKQKFTDDLKLQLGRINERLQILSNLINELKNKATNLETQIGTNSSSIDEKEKQLQELRDQMARLTSEKDQLSQQFNQYRDETQKNIADQQTKIDNYEAQLRDLTQQKEAAVNQAISLQTELQNKGDQQAVHAEEIKRLTEESQKQLQEQEQQLMLKINECEEKLKKSEEQLINKDAEHQQTKQQIDQQLNQNQGQLTDLQKQIDQLKQENQSLVQRLVAATEAINQASEDLIQLTESVPNVQTKQDVDKLLGEISQKIESSIENIGRAAQGQGPQPPLPPRNNVGGPLPRPSFTDNDTVTLDGKPVQIGQLKAMLRDKDAILKRNLSNYKPDNQYKKALNEINNAASLQNILDILKRNGVGMKNDKIFGGRKKRTKKNKKQKGGFTYKKNFKRTGITSRSSYKRSSRRTKRSSR